MARIPVKPVEVESFAVEADADYPNAFALVHRCNAFPNGRRIMVDTDLGALLKWAAQPHLKIEAVTVNLASVRVVGYGKRAA